MKYEGEEASPSTYSSDEAAPLSGSDRSVQPLPDVDDRQQAWLQCREEAARRLGIPIERMPDMITEDYRLIAKVCGLAAGHEDPGMLVELSDVAQEAGTHTSRIVARYKDLIEKLASHGWVDVLPPTPSDSRGIRIIEAMINAGKPAKAIGAELGIDPQKVMWRVWQMRKGRQAG